MTENNSDPTRRTFVRLLFEERPPGEHNEFGVDLFYAWLEKRHPELLNWGVDDPHEQLYRVGLVRVTATSGRQEVLSRLPTDVLERI